MKVQLQQMRDINFTSARNADLFVCGRVSSPRGRHIFNEIGHTISEKWEIRQSARADKDGGAERVVAVESLSVALISWISLCSSPRPTIALDVSCMSRPAMAEAFRAVFEASMHKPVTLKVIYVIAGYTPPPEGLPPNEDIRPISDWFAGWPNDATAITSLVVGLGYENDKALGACEYFDVGDTWVLAPKSPIVEYDHKVERNNQELLARAGRRDHVIPYRVDRPTDTFGQLAATVSRILPKMNPVLLPFGPKIFFALNLLVAAVYREAGVWHVTGDTDLPDVQEEPSSYIPAFQLDLGPEAS